jgi:heptaprenyl diphosphate synthase
MDVASALGLPTLGDELRRVETALREAVTSDDAFLTEVARHLIDAGGKRLRPALALAAAHAGGREPTEEVVLGGVAVELVHLGSLYHDDVMDEADTRRSVESVNARWGNLVAILAGDFLLARASSIASSLGTEVAGLLAATIGRLCEGQVRELQHLFDVARTEGAYLSAITGKTAALMASSCRIGALTAELPREQVDALTAFGERLGMVFQIVDDVLDVVATDEQLGKPAGKDLVEGVYTLPVIRALADDVTGPKLRAMLGQPVEVAVSAEARDVVRSDGAVDAALGLARQYARDAAAALAPLGDRPVVSAMAGLGDQFLAAIPL